MTFLPPKHPILPPPSSSLFGQIRKVLFVVVVVVAVAVAVVVAVAVTLSVFSFCCCCCYLQRFVAIDQQQNGEN